MTVQVNDFIWLHLREDITNNPNFYKEVVGLMCNETDVRRLWDEFTDEWHPDRIERNEMFSWVGAGVGDSHHSIVIGQDDPRYDALWAWFTACEMTSQLISPPPLKGLNYDR